MSLYTLSVRQVKFVHDSPERVDFHIRSDDYLAFMATKLGFLEEALQKCASTDLSNEERVIAKELRADLRYAQANYKVIPRDEVLEVRPSGNLLSK